MVDLSATLRRVRGQSVSRDQIAADPHAVGVGKLQGEQGAWTARRRAEYRLSGDRYRQLAGQLASAAAQLHVLPMPPDLDAAVAAANQYVEKLSDQRTPELIAQWPAVRALLLAATKKLNES
jgi:hypothetical protein